MFDQILSATARHLIGKLLDRAGSRLGIRHFGFLVMLIPMVLIVVVTLIYGNLSLAEICVTLAGLAVLLMFLRRGLSSTRSVIDDRISHSDKRPGKQT